MFSSLESQGLRSHHLWGSGRSIPTAPTGARSSAPSRSATAPPTRSTSRRSSPTAASSSSRTTTSTTSASACTSSSRRSRRKGTRRSARATSTIRAMPPLRHGRHGDGRPIYIRFPFSPYGIEALTPFVLQGRLAVAAGDPRARRTRRASASSRTRPARPDNHLLTVWSPGSVNSHAGTRRRSTAASTSSRPASRSTSRARCCSSRTIRSTTSNGRAPWCPTSASTASTSRRVLPPLANDGKRSPHLPEGTPFGLVGTSSLYKRESYPYGVVPPGNVTATFAERQGPDRRPRPRSSATTGPCRAPTPACTATTTFTPSASCSWSRHRARRRPKRGTPLLQPRPRTHAHPRRDSRCAKFDERRNEQPLDPDGNPDTSFLAKIPPTSPGRSRRSTRTAWC